MNFFIYLPLFGIFYILIEAPRPPIHVTFMYNCLFPCQWLWGLELLIHAVPLQQDGTATGHLPHHQATHPSHQVPLSHPIKTISPEMILLAHHWLSRPTTEPSPHPTKMEEINECSSIPPLFGKKYHLSSSTRPHSTIIGLFVKGSTATPQATGADQLQDCHFPYLAASLPHRNLWH